MNKSVKAGLGLVAVAGVGVSVEGQQVQVAEIENASTEVVKESQTNC